MMISRDERPQPLLGLAVESGGEMSGAGPTRGLSEMTSPRTRSLERFWNLPNTITTLRIAVVPVLLLLPWAQDKFRSQVMAWLFIIAATTDILDGWLARRGHQVTHIGKLLDPLADKLMVSTALVMLVATDRIPIWAAWMVVVILGRELAVTGLRGIASADGQVMSASWLGKAKAFAQNFAIGALLFHYTTLGLPAHELGLVSLAVATVLAFWSGYLYFAEYFRGRARAEREEGGK
ncbi:CDP-diacylglycerol--glycerol-3-phosphate 3-phosphatidyltransferase [Myxococcota bacterium]|nr:CDP-diacylglycerol--glycerol-3-phosphate 3-phosphatidyltransferase [Myxococcota bacterium]